MFHTPLLEFYAIDVLRIEDLEGTRLRWMPRGSRLFGIPRVVVLGETKRTTMVTTLTACVIVLGRAALPSDV